MATRAKKSRGKSGAKTAAKRSGSSARRGKPALKKKSGNKKVAAKKAPAKRAVATPAKKAAPKRASAAPKKTVIKRAAAKKPAKPSNNPITRMTRVAKEVAQQASTAVSEGVESLKELGESIVERVSG